LQFLTEIVVMTARAMLPIARLGTSGASPDGAEQSTAQGDDAQDGQQARSALSMAHRRRAAASASSVRGHDV